MYELEGGSWTQAGDGTWTTDSYTYYTSFACSHCDNPACVQVCPTGAMHKGDNGLVSVDAHRCIGCGYCSAHPGHCVFDGDDVADLFRRMEHADSLILNIPVYFYGPPALLKGFIDRAQIFWEQRREGTRTPRRPAHAVLCAGRTRGDRLFEANLLILRCFLDTLGFSLHEPLLLRGVERPTDLLHSQAIAQIERFGLEAAEQATRFYHE